MYKPRRLACEWRRNFHNFTFESLQDGREIRVTLALGQHLKAVMMIPYILLVDAQHRQKHVEQITWKTVDLVKESVRAVLMFGYIQWNYEWFKIVTAWILILWCEIIHKLSQHNNHYQALLNLKRAFQFKLMSLTRKCLNALRLTSLGSAAV